MSDEESAFLAAIADAPDDDTPRLVYADWLEERGRRECDFLRLECEVVKRDRDLASLQQLRDKAEDEETDFELAVDPLFEIIEPAEQIAQLKAVGRDLDRSWIESVCRIPMERYYAREREIRSWLRRRVTVAEMLAKMAKWDKPSTPRRSVWKRVVNLFRSTSDRPQNVVSEWSHVRSMQNWVETNLQPGDELWEYDTGGESWSHMCGEMGYAILRRGEVLEFEVLLMN